MAASLRRKSPADALRAGIAMVHQELSLAADLTVAENILAGLEPRWGWFVDWRKLYERASEMLAEFCPAIDAWAAVSSLGMGYRQVVEILKALAWEPKVIIFDEPTSSLEVNEAELVLETIRKLKAKSVGVVYISHRMDEVFRISDRITVLRDGARVGSWKTRGHFPPRGFARDGRPRLDPVVSGQSGNLRRGPVFGRAAHPRGSISGHQLRVASPRDPRFLRAGGSRSDGVDAGHFLR